MTKCVPASSAVVNAGPDEGCRRLSWQASLLIFSDRRGRKPSEEMDDSKRKLEEMAEKLEKSEAGRKKLRQAISMLKEKMDATEKVLQVNETLRQECEKERLLAETERKKAEEEKTLRLRIEKENLSIKEQFVGVLQRLDAVEKSSIFDRAETIRVRGEVKQALSALSGALQVAEAAQCSVQGLEKFVQEKVISSVSTSTKALSLARSVTSDVKAAQGSAASAEKTSQSLSSRLAVMQKQVAGLDDRVNLLQQETAKAFSLAQSASSDAKVGQVAALSADKTSQSLVARIAAVQKQSAGFDQRVNLLQQELRTRFVDDRATSKEARTVNGAVPCAGKKGKGMVLSKSQQLAGASVNIPKLPQTSSVGGIHDTGQRETVVSLSGVPKSQFCEPIQVVPSGSSSGCLSSVSKELEVSVKNKDSNPLREPSVATVTKVQSVTSRLTGTPTPRLQKIANTPVSRSVHSHSAKSLSRQENIQSASKLSAETSGRANVDSTNGSFSVAREPIGSPLIDTDVTVPQISATTRRKASSKKCSGTGPINSSFSGRQRACGAVITEKDRIEIIPLRMTEAEKGLNVLDVGEDKVANGQRKVKLPAAILKDIRKLFSKEKKVQSRMEAKFVALEQLLRSGGDMETLEEVSIQKNRKRKRRQEVSSRKCNEREIGDCDLNLKTKCRRGTAPDARDTQDCPDRLAKQESMNMTKDRLTRNPPTPLQSTPPFALPKVSERLTTETSLQAELQQQSGNEIWRGDSRAVSVSGLNGGDRCRSLEQPKGMQAEEENYSETVKWCRDLDVHKGRSNELTDTCNWGLPERAQMSGDDTEHYMDIDKGNGKSVDQIREGTGHGWDTGSDFSDDEFDAEWWTTERVLLSPTLPELRPSLFSEGQHLDVGPVHPEPVGMSLEDVALFLGELPPIAGEESEEIKDFELQHLSDNPTSDASLSDKRKVIASMAPKSAAVDALDERKAAQKEDVLDNNGGSGTGSPELVTSFTSTSRWDSKIPGEDCRRGQGDNGNISTNAFETNVVHQYDNTGGREVLGQCQTFILTQAVDGKLGNSEVVRSLVKDDKENMVRNCNSSQGSVQLTGLGSCDFATLPQETSMVSTTGSLVNLKKSLKCESKDEAGEPPEIECQVRIGARTLDSEISGVFRTSGKEDKENTVRGGSTSESCVQVTRFRAVQSVLLPQERNTVATSNNTTNLQKPMNCVFGEEAREHEDVENKVRVLPLSVDRKLEVPRVDCSLEKDDQEINARKSTGGRGSVKGTSLPPSDTVLLPPETSVYSLIARRVNVQESLNSESGGDARELQDQETQIRVLASTVDSKLVLPLMDWSLEKRARDNLVRDDIMGRGSVQVTVSRPCDPVQLGQDSSIVAIPGSFENLRSHMNCEPGVEARRVQVEESTAKIEDGYPGFQRELGAKTNCLYGLKLLAWSSVDNTSIRFTELNKYCRLQIPWEVQELSSFLSRTRACILEALEEDNTSETKIWTPPIDFALRLAKSNLSGMNLFSIFTASLIDACSWWESETSSRAPSQCRFSQFLAVLVDEVLKAENFRQAFPSEFHIADVFADQLQEFLIRGTVRPENPSWDYGKEGIMFEIPSTTSVLERIRTVTSASKLLASLCLGAGKTNCLRRSIYLILRFCTMDSSWLLAAISSFATLCGRQLFTAGADDIVGQAVLVVISELLSDADGTNATRNENVPTGSSSENADDGSQEQEKKPNMSAKIDQEITSKISSTNLGILRDSVGKFENDLNFEVLLPQIIQSFFDVISPNFVETTCGSQHISSKLHYQSEKSFGDSEVVSDAAALADSVDGSSESSLDIEREHVHRCCWQCNYSSYNGFKSIFFETNDTVTRNRDPFIAWEQKFHEITHALELIAYHLGWEWTYNDFIVEHLWKRVYSGASDITVAFVAKSLGIFGRLGIEIDGTELQGVKELRQILIAILKMGDNVAGVDRRTVAFSLTAQVAAVRSLLNLCRDVKKHTEKSPFSVGASRASILAWFHALDPAALESLPSSLRSLLSNFEV